MTKGIFEICASYFVGRYKHENIFMMFWVGTSFIAASCNFPWKYSTSASSILTWSWYRNTFISRPLNNQAYVFLLK